MSEDVNKIFEQTAAFQNLWLDSMSRMAGVWSQYSPGSPPPEEINKIRSGVLKVLSETWEEFMRTPQFMEMMKASLNGALDLRRFARDGMHKVHEQFETPDKNDIDGVLLAIRHVERRILDRLDGFEERLAEVKERIGALEKTEKDQPRPADRGPHRPTAQSPLKQSKATKPSSKK